MLKRSVLLAASVFILTQTLQPLWSAEPVVRLRKPDARTDAAELTKLVQSAFTEAGKTDRALVIEAGTYHLEDTIRFGNLKEIRGIGSPRFVMKNPQKDIFRSVSMWRTKICGIMFEGGHDQLVLGNGNIDRGHYVISNCRFIESAGTGIRILPKTDSTQVIVEKCTFDCCRQALVSVTDQSIFRDSWIQTAKKNPDNLAVIENHNHLLAENIVGVPLVVDSDLRWINNYGTRLTCRNFRFGGEGGGFTPVVNFSKPAKNMNSLQILLEDCVMSAEGNHRRKCAVYCEEIPNGIILKNCCLLGIPPIRISPKIDIKTYFRDIMPGMLRFDFRDNIGEFVNVLPEGFSEAAAAAGKNKFSYPRDMQLSPAETTAALDAAAARLQNFPPFKDGYDSKGRKCRNSPGTFRSITTESHLWKLDDFMDATTEPCSEQLSLRGCGESTILLNRVSKLRHPHVRIKNAEVDLDRFPFLTWRLRDTRIPGGHIAVKIIDLASEKESIVLEDYSDRQFNYQAFDLRKILNRKSGKAMIDIKIYLTSPRVNIATRTDSLEKGQFFILDFLRLEEP